MSLIPLLQESFIDIYRDPDASYLHADWKGYLSEDQVRTGCERIFDCLVLQGVDSVLNDNTHVLGMWSAAADWVADDWFPRMRQAGLTRFAWVESPNRLSQLSIQKTMAVINTNVYGVQLFHEKPDAIAWLSQALANTEIVQKLRLKVLVVEDNADFSELFHSLLHTMGCQPQIASNVNAGLALARQMAPDMIFCDIGLPGNLNGYDLATAVRTDPLLQHIPLIAVSGRNSRQDKAHAKSVGFDRMFTKPVKFSDVSEALASFSKGKPAERRIIALPVQKTRARRHYDKE